MKALRISAHSHNLQLLPEALGFFQQALFKGVRSGTYCGASAQHSALHICNETRDMCVCVCECAHEGISHVNKDTLLYKAKEKKTLQLKQEKLAKLTTIVFIFCIFLKKNHFWLEIKGICFSDMGTI